MEQLIEKVDQFDLVEISKSFTGPLIGFTCALKSYGPEVILSLHFDLFIVIYTRHS